MNVNTRRNPNNTEKHMLGIDEDGNPLYPPDFWETEDGEELIYEQMLANRDD
jgi:hypothetical protein